MYDSKNISICSIGDITTYAIDWELFEFLHKKYNQQITDIEIKNAYQKYIMDLKNNPDTTHMVQNTNNIF